MSVVTAISRVAVKGRRPYRWIGLTVLLGLLAAVGVGLVLAYQAPSPTQTFKYLGSMPNWDLDEMVQRSRAVVIGAFIRELGTKEIPLGEDDGETLFSVVVDYEFQVDEALLPRGAGFPKRIAVSTNAAKRLGPDIRLVSDSVPKYAIGERVLLFLERLPDDAYARIPQIVVPEGFTRDTYLNHLVSAKYGKLVQYGDEWYDSRTGASLSPAQIESAIARSQ